LIAQMGQPHSTTKKMVRNGDKKGKEEALGLGAHRQQRNSDKVVLAMAVGASGSRTALLLVTAVPRCSKRRRRNEEKVRCR
jgi:hypothetical protein